MIHRLLARGLLKVTGWEARGRYPHELKKFIIVEMPHTSNWDFIIGLLFKWALGMRHIKVFIKKELFFPPLGWFLKAVGGYPVDRSGGLSYVDLAVQAFKKEPALVLTITPEGTRKKVSRLRTGFYHMARLAGIPLVLARLDYATRTLAFSEPFYVSGDMDKDMPQILHFFRGAKGKVEKNNFLSEKV